MKLILPELRSSPITASIRVVLPAPFGPITVTIWPSSTVRETELTAWTLP